MWNSQSVGGDLSPRSAASWKARLLALVRDAPDYDSRVVEARARLSYWRIRRATEQEVDAQIRCSPVRAGRRNFNSPQLGRRCAFWAEVQLSTGDDVVRQVLVLGRQVQLLYDRGQIDATVVLRAYVSGERGDGGAVAGEPHAGHASAEVAFGRRGGAGRTEECADYCC
jgi:hypothetical protein